MLQKITTHFRRKEDHGNEKYQEHYRPNDIFHGVIGMKGYAIKRYTVCTLHRLDFDAIRIVGTHLM